MRILRVEVTEADIRRGKPTDFHECPVALALNRQYPITSGW
jgi:hypothetical protein